LTPETPVPAKLPVVVLTGFMGTGKSAVGKALSEILGLAFIDSDAEIERAEGASVADIFESKGEAHFRSLEATFCKNLEGTTGAVIATGGGMILDESNRALLSDLGPTVLLQTSLDTLVDRLGTDASRPVLGSDSPSPAEARERIADLLDERGSVYGAIDFKVDTSDLTPEKAAMKIAARLDMPVTSLVVHISTSREPAPAGRYGPSRIEIGRGVLSKLGQYLRDEELDGRVFLLMPQNLQDLYLEQIQESLDDVSINADVLTIRDGDAEKHLPQVAEIIDALIDAGARRDATIVPIGGGVTGDIGGFVASAFMRGVPLVQVPTTLLAQVDSSVGAKVGVNHPRAKNLIGAFYQPHFILDDPCTFRTLPMEEVSNGMAEVVKSAMMASADVFAFLEDQLTDDASIRLRDLAFLERCVVEAAGIKTNIVNGDPLERGDRRFMNFGHTLGHALETLGHYKGLKHGQAVSLGMIAALRIAVRRGRIDEDLLNRAFAVLEWCGLPVEFESFDRDALSEAMLLDKKIKRGRLHFVLPTGLGSAEVVDDVTVDEILSVIEEG